MTRDLLELLPEDATAELDPRRLRRLPTEHVAAGGQRRRADMAWAVGTLGGRAGRGDELQGSLQPRGGTRLLSQEAGAAAGSKGEALLALEFQSSPDRAMALRMEIYVALLRQEVAAEGGLRAGDLLPRVLPVVVYTGGRRWRPETLDELTAPTPAGWGGWLARFEFLCLDAADLTAEDGRSNPVAALLRLLASWRAESVPALAKALFEGLRAAGSGAERQAFANRLARALMQLLIARFAGDEAGDRHQHMQQALRYMEEPTMLAEAITEWRQNAIAEGRTEGRTEGLREGTSRSRTLLLRLAARRFGVEAGDEFGRLLAEEEDVDRLALAGDLVIDCSNAEELLGQARRLLSEGSPIS